MTFTEWLQFGIANGFCTESFCNTHDGYPMHATEEADWEAGGDPCAVMVRIGKPEDWALAEITQ